MRTGNSSRARLRGSRLLPQCQRARISHNESPGVDACYGLTDRGESIYNDECRACGALVWNYGDSYGREHR